MKKFNKIAYNKAYNKENYKEMKIRLRKDDYEKICYKIGVAYTRCSVIIRL